MSRVKAAARPRDNRPLAGASRPAAIPATEPAEWPDMHAVAAELVRIYESWHHPQEAAAWRAQLATLEATTPRP